MGETTQPDLAQRQPPTLWRNISFMLMWTSVAASGFGDRVIMLAAEHLMGINADPGTGVAAKEAAAAAIKISAGVTFAFFVPYLLFTLIGGWLADRLPRKWIMLACDELRALVLLVAWIMAGRYMTREAGTDPFRAIEEAEQWKVLGIIAATGTFAAIFNPSKFATLPQIVRRNDLQPANAVLAGIGMIASLIGLAVGGFVKTNLQGAILIGVLCYAISGTFFAFLRPVQHKATEKTKGPGIVEQVSAAVNYMRHHRTVRNLILLNIMFWAACWIVSAAVVGLTKGYYNIPNADFFEKKNLMMMIFGGGMLCGSVVMVFIKERRISGIIAMLALVAAALCMFGLAINRIYELGLVLGFFAGFFGLIFLINIDALTQSLTPDYLRGRVFGLRSMLNTTGTVVINLIIWRLPGEKADQIVIWALGVTAGILLCVATFNTYTLLISGPMPTKWINTIWRVIRLFTFSWHHFKWTNRHYVPSKGPVVLVSNHTAGIDPFLIQVAIPRRIRYMMTSSYRFAILNVIWLAADPIMVELDGKDIAAVRQVLNALKKDDIIGIFPEGGLQREQRELQAFSPGIGLIARKSQAVIIPIWIYGTAQTKWMIWHFLKPTRSRVIYGKPFRADPNMTNKEVTEDLRRRMLELAKTVEPKKHAVLICPACQYDLRGTLEAGRNTCPECGLFIPPEDDSPPASDQTSEDSQG